MCFYAFALFQGSVMRLFALMMVLLGAFVFLLTHFSFWTVFGTMYMLGMLMVACVSCLDRKKAPAPLAWREPVEFDEAA